MERIQSALAKARARRSEQTASEAPARHDRGAPAGAAATAELERPTAVPGPAPAAAPEPAPEPAPAGPDIVANWEALAEFRPKPRLMRRNRIVAFERGPEAGDVDMMRTRILQQMRLNGWRRIAVTSPGAGCGKTTTCLNLAFSLSRLSDQRTILAEMDMRRPGLAIALGMKPRSDFAQVIAGDTEAGDQMQRYGANLAFGANAAPVANPSELLQGPPVGPALARIEAEYAPTVMLFDMPPMLTSDDMLAFAPHVDCVLLLAAAEQTSINDVDNCEKELAAHTNVLGVVLNKCRFVGKGHGYGYY